MVNYQLKKLDLFRRFGNLSNIKSKKTIRKYYPGQHGENKSKLKNKRSNSDYTSQLNEKQKIRFNYNITESQLYNYLKKASKKKGIIGSNLIEVLEMRLDSILVTSNLIPNLFTARQVISHGHIIVNKNNINIPSFICKKNDLIELKNISKSLSLINKNLILIPKTNFNFENKIQSYQIKIKANIKRNDINLKINENLILEYYSRT
jgi:small subunit ribosomal protein S4